MPPPPHHLSLASPLDEDGPWDLPPPRVHFASLIEMILDYDDNYPHTTFVQDRLNDDNSHARPVRRQYRITNRDMDFVTESSSNEQHHSLHPWPFQGMRIEYPGNNIPLHSTRTATLAATTTTTIATPALATTQPRMAPSMTPRMTPPAGVPPMHTRTLEQTPRPPTSP